MQLPTWAPTHQQVAARIMARTRATNGDLTGTFTAQTIPTNTQVAEVVNQAVALLTPRLGPMAERLEDQARALAALRAAYMIELAYFPEQAETGVSPYNALRMEFKDELANYDEAARGLEPNSEAHIHSLKVQTDYPGYATFTY